MDQDDCLDLAAAPTKYGGLGQFRVRRRDLHRGGPSSATIEAGACLRWRHASENGVPGDRHGVPKLALMCLSRTMTTRAGPRHAARSAFLADRCPHGTRSAANTPWGARDRVFDRPQARD